MHKLILQTLRKKVLKNFKCQNCGNCCKFKGYVYVTPEEIQKIAAYLNIFIFDFMNKYTVKKNNQYLISSPIFNPTCFLDENNRCKIYPVRPKSCQTYPDWDTIWQNQKNLQEEKTNCLGLKLYFTN